MHKCLQVLRVYPFFFKPFFGPKIPLMFTFLVTHAYSIKKSHNQVGNPNTCEMFNEVLTDICCPFVTFSNDRGMVELQN